MAIAERLIRKSRNGSFESNCAMEKTFLQGEVQSWLYGLQCRLSQCHVSTLLSQDCFLLSNIAKFIVLLSHVKRLDEKNAIPAVVKLHPEEMCLCESWSSTSCDSNQTRPYT